jgi:hypothetical protein
MRAWTAARKSCGTGEKRRKFCRQENIPLFAAISLNICIQALACGNPWLNLKARTRHHSFRALGNTLILASLLGMFKHLAVSIFGRARKRMLARPFHCSTPAMLYDRGAAPICLFCAGMRLASAEAGTGPWAQDGAAAKRRMCAAAKFHGVRIFIFGSQCAK